MNAPVTPPAESPVPFAVAEVLAVFADALDGVQFPDVDRAALDRLAADVAARAVDVAEARRALAETEAQLAESVAVLTRRAEVGLAYARVYAEASDPALAERLSQISLGRAARVERRVPAQPTAPRRARKSATVDGEPAAREPTEPQLALAEDA